MQPCSLSFYAGNFSTWEEVATEKHFPDEDISAKVKMTPVEMLIYPKITRFPFLHMAKIKRSHCSTAQLKILLINCLFLPAKMKVPKINISKKSTQVTDLQSQTAGMIWRRAVTLSTHGGSQRAQHFIERYCMEPLGAHTPTQQHEPNRKTNSHRVRFKHTDKYCTCAGLHN